MHAVQMLFVGTSGRSMGSHFARPDPDPKGEPDIDPSDKIRTHLEESTTLTILRM